MDVERSQFFETLLSILEAIADSHFVSFDLELSGIASKKKKEGSDNKSGKQSLQDRYAETKEAAERYQILQFGLTCVQEDFEKDMYIVKPYNFNLSPVAEERLGIERIFSFQSGAVEFLLSHGFQMEKPFTVGIPYLSRVEAKEAEVAGLAKMDKSAVEDIQLSIDDVESLQLMQRVRDQINEWQKTGKPFPDMLNIAPVGFDEADPVTRMGLNRYEKRLIHQLVRAEYPDLITISRQDYILIKPLDAEREAEFKEKRVKQMKERIIAQTGFRWIIEALVADGDLTKVTPWILGRDFTGQQVPFDYVSWKMRLDRAKGKLYSRRPVIVGHNMFTDLVNFYCCFIGPLPDTVEQHLHNINKIFPRVIDTKYLATHDAGDITLKSSLEDIEEQLRNRPFPIIETHIDHSKYHTLMPFHEAGFDSFLTAKVAMRLSTKLESEKAEKAEKASAVQDLPHRTLSPTSEEFETASEGNGGISLRLRDPPLVVVDPFDPELVPNARNTNGTSAPIPSTDGTVAEALKSKSKKKSKNKGKNKGKKSNTETVKQASSRFASQTLFDKLKAIDSEDSESPADGAAEVQQEENEAVLDFDDLPTVTDGHDPWDASQDRESTATRSFDGKLMPPFGSPFWQEYGNKLRVFGTVEEVCELGRW